ncbi:10 kDa chaperonin, partial [Haemophilus influenzae]
LIISENDILAIVE